MKRFRNAVFGLLFLPLIFACENDSHEGIPAELDAEIAAIENCSCYPWVKEYLWRGERVYVQGGSGPACLWAPVFYNAAGGKFELPANYTFNDFNSDSRFIREVWSCKPGDDAQSD